MHLSTTTHKRKGNQEQEGEETKKMRKDRDQLSPIIKRLPNTFQLNKKHKQKISVKEQKIFSISQKKY